MKIELISNFNRLTFLSYFLYLNENKYGTDLNNNIFTVRSWGWFMKGKLGSDIDGHMKRSSDLDNQQFYLPYDIQLLSILNDLSYSPIQNQFAVLSTDITERKEIEKELKETVNKLNYQLLKLLTILKFIFTMRSD